MEDVVYYQKRQGERPYENLGQLPRSEVVKNSGVPHGVQKVEKLSSSGRRNTTLYSAFTWGKEFEILSGAG